MPALFNRVRELAADTDGGLFQVPPYFAYIAKSFSVLEGIGLSVDDNYSIVDETLPYISKRILTDPSPRTAGALESFLFGDDKEDHEVMRISGEVLWVAVNTHPEAAVMISEVAAIPEVKALEKETGRKVASDKIAFRQLNWGAAVSRLTIKQDDKIIFNPTGMKIEASFSGGTKPRQIVGSVLWAEVKSDSIINPATGAKKRSRSVHFSFL